MADACTVCKKTSPQVTLKRCAKCSTTPYCSRDCQKSDWKSHRKVCGKAMPSSLGGGGGSSNSAGQLSPPKGLDQPIAKPFTRLCNKTWLHDRPEVDVYRLLLDTYRLRVDDDYVLSGERQPDSIPAGAADGSVGFARFLDLATSRPGLLPPWWTAANADACKALGMDASQWHDLRRSASKADIQDHYGHPQFPMQLRMFAEAVIGHGTAGSNGASMMQMMAAMEGGGGIGGNMYAHMLDARSGKTTDL